MPSLLNFMLQISGSTFIIKVKKQRIWKSNFVYLRGKGGTMSQEINTYLADQIEQSEYMAKYDLEVKKLLASKQILSRILKYTTKEFADYSFEEIMQCIEGEPEINTVILKPGKRKPEAITGTNIEDKVKNEGEIFYDIRFYAVTKQGQHIKILFNVEAQKSSYPGYMLERRGVFYAARMISAQLEQEFIVPHYDDIKKVYSIWICMEPSKKLANTIVEYHMAEREIYGSVKRENVCDLLSVIMIRLSAEDDIAVSENKLIGMLDILLSQKLPVKVRKSILSGTYGLQMTEQIEGGMAEMCNLSDLIAEKSMARGIAQGITQGIAQGITEGIAKGKIEIALNLIAGGVLNDEQIAAATGLSVDRVQDLHREPLSI